MPAAVAELVRAVAARELHPVDLVTRALAAIEGGADLNALITVCPDQALARARTPLNGPLAGVPVLVKDVLHTAGVRTTAGSRLYADNVPRMSAPAVSALEAAGAIVIGKTNCDEFEWGVTGQNTFFGDVRNPRCPGRITGGSSSGNGAALAAGFTPLALGTDTGGSVRMPAACCRVVGMKPLLGAVSTAGMFPLCPSFDTVGPMARTVEDCLLCFEALTRAPVPERDVRGLRVGVLSAMPVLGPGEAPPERDERTLTHATEIEGLGMHVEEVRMPVPEADVWPVFYAEAATSHRATFPARSGEYGPTIRAKLERAQETDPASVLDGRRALQAWRAAARQDPAVDVFLSPTLGVREIPREGVDELEIRVPFSGYTRVFSFLGWPAIALGGLQVVARDEAVLFAVARAWEQAYGAPGPS